MKRKTLIFLVCLIFASSGMSQEPNPYYEELVQENSDVKGLNITEIKKPGLEYPEDKIILAFEASKDTENKDYTFNITYNNTQLNQNFPNSSLFLFKGEKLSLYSSVAGEKHLHFPVRDSGSYYLIEVRENINRDEWGYYITDGNCDVLLSPGAYDLKVGSCDSIKAIILTNVVYFGLFCVLSGLAAYLLLPKVLEKIILRKNNKVMKKAAELGEHNSRNSMLKRLITADEEALKGNYIKAYRIIKEIEETLES